VGSWAADILSEAGGKVLAVSDVSHALVNEGGLDIKALRTHVAQGAARARVVWCGVLCCAVLCCAVLCCVVLCCAVLCCVVLCVVCCVRVRVRVSSVVCERV
jgi:glutamate dehydrogenase/leucine dehydrogenase